MDPVRLTIYFLIAVCLIMVFCGYKIFRGNWGYLSGGVVHPEQTAESTSEDLEKKEKKERMERRRKIVARIFSYKSSTNSSASLTPNDEGEGTPRVLTYDNESAKYELQPKTESNVTSKDCSICLEDFGKFCALHHF